MIALANWQGVFSQGVDSACHLDKETVVFFAGSEFVKYDLLTEKALPGYPKKIDQESWPGLSFAK